MPNLPVARVALLRMADALSIKAVPSLRDDHEARVQRAVAKALKQQHSAILDKVGDPPDLGKLDTAFWNSLDDATRAELEKVLRRVYLDSAAELIADMPIGVDWGAVNTAAANWAKQYTYDLVKGVNATTREALQAQVGGFYDVQGTTIGDLRKQLEPLFGVERAASISITETTRASVEGQRGTVERIKQDSGIVMRAHFITDRDESVCPRCKPLDKVAANADGTYTNPNTGAIESPPPVHPYCLTGDSRVLAFGVSAASKRWYDGQIVIIRTASGNQLSCTLNHPILTDAGWVAAGLLNESSNVISSGGAQGHRGRVNLNHENVPTCIEEIAQSFGGAPYVVATPVPLSAEDFHGDGVGSQVAIIYTNGLLRNARNAARCKHGLHFDFGGGSVVSPDALHSLGAFQFCSQGERLASHSLMRRLDLQFALAGRHPAPLQEFGFGLGADVNVGFDQVAANNVALNTKLFSNGLLGFARFVGVDNFGDGEFDATRISSRLLPYAPLFQAVKHSVVADTDLDAQILRGAPGGIFTDKVVSVQHQAFSGHVFNLETNSSLYVAEGIITHNCRCNERWVMEEVA